MLLSAYMYNFFGLYIQGDLTNIFIRVTQRMDRYVTKKAIENHNKIDNFLNLLSLCYPF